MRHLWSLLCERTLISEQNNISIIEVLEQLAFDLLPEGDPEANPVMGGLTLVSLFSREDLNEPESFQYKLRIVGPNGTQMGETAQRELSLQEHRRVRSINRLDGIPLTAGAGVYEFEVIADGTVVASVPLEVIITGI